VLGAKPTAILPRERKCLGKWRVQEKAQALVTVKYMIYDRRAGFAIDETHPGAQFF
jgi:hypothetical protein